MAFIKNSELGGKTPSTIVYSKNSVAASVAEEQRELETKAKSTLSENFTIVEFEQLIKNKSNFEVNYIPFEEQYNLAAQAIISTALQINIYNSPSPRLLKTILPLFKGKKVIVIYDTELYNTDALKNLKKDNDITFRKVRKKYHTKKNFIVTDNDSVIQEFFDEDMCDFHTELFLFKPILAATLQREFQKRLIDSIYLPFMK